MAISVNVTGTLRLPSGLPAAYSTIRFVLVRPNILGGAVVVPYSVRATADINGLFTISVSPNMAGTHYVITACKANGLVLLDTIAVVPDSNCLLSQIIQMRPTPPIDAAQAALIDLQAALAAVEAVRQQVVAIALALENGDAQTIPVVAGEALGGNRAVVINASGVAIYADCGNLTHLGRFAGITTGAAPLGSSITILPSGIMVEPSWAWTVNAPVFMGSNGILVQTKPITGFQQVLGIAVSATTLFVNPREPIFTI